MVPIPVLGLIKLFRQEMGFDPTEILLEDGDLPPLYEALQDRDFETATKLISDGAKLEIPGWMAISAVDQAWYEVRGTRETLREIRAMLASFPSSLREKQNEQNRRMESDG
ncbi:MAG: hypothetical protein ACKV19_21540 [Verrucomicrobiales bacterium]